MFNITIKKCLTKNKTLLIFFAICCSAVNGYAQDTSIGEDPITQKFYAINHQNLYWFSGRKNIKKATQWLTVIESAGNLGLVPEKLRTARIRTAMNSNNIKEKIFKDQTDKEITGLVLNFLKVLQQGNTAFDYDEVSRPRDSVYIYQLLNSKPGEPVSAMVARLECKDHD